MKIEPASPEVLELSARWMEAGLTRDLEFLRAHSATPDPSAVHTIPGTPAGRGLTLEEFLSHLSEVPPRYTVTSDPHGYLIDGQAAWTTDYFTVDMLDEGVLEGRYTSVLVLIDGEWKVVHAHMSEPVSHQF
jgi:hypothetical protein